MANHCRTAKDVYKEHLDSQEIPKFERECTFEFHWMNQPVPIKVHPSYIRKVKRQLRDMGSEVAE